jgi:hypothetical protein
MCHGGDIERRSVKRTFLNGVLKAVTIGASAASKAVMTAHVNLRYALDLACCLVIFSASQASWADAPEAAPYAASAWWQPGDGRPLPARSDYVNDLGRLGVVNAEGAVVTKGHPFFTPLGSNGRACVTCHQPASGMGLSVDSIRRRWDESGAKDPLFAAIDGSNCPNLLQSDKASHSLLLERGLFRIYLPWPPRGSGGNAAIEPEFTIEVVRDPTGCNLDPVYGLSGTTPTISVFRRPRPVSNLKYLLELPHGVPPSEFLFYNDKSLLPRDPDTGGFASMQLMSDGRDITPKIQARDAARSHLQANAVLTDLQVAQIEAFEKQIYAAQNVDKAAGELVGDNTPPGLGPEALEHGAPARLGNNPINRIFGSFGMWHDIAPGSSESDAQRAQRNSRESIARGADIFYLRRFVISNVGKYNDKGVGNPFKRSCGGGCHNTLLMGMDLAPGYMDLGLNNMPWANARPDLPLFKVVCQSTALPQSYLGRVIYTHDPGRALVTGKCADVGASMTQQSRSLAARAPYFMNGSAANLRELVDFYDRRFNIGYTELEKQDLVNFLGVL